MPKTFATLRSALLIAPIVVLLSACHTPPGQMRDDGSITPCRGHRKDHQLCGNATYNATRIQGVSVGQTREQVRTAMAHDPEQRTAKTEGGKSIEVWQYMTNYQQRTWTQISFVNGVATAITSITR
jgi:hypothetical protein